MGGLPEGRRPGQKPPTSELMEPRKKRGVEPLTRYHRGAGRARQLLSELLNQAKDQSLDHVFVLTTQSTHWFLEQGFEAASLEQLPVEKQRLYNWQRNAAVLRRAV